MSNKRKSKPARPAIFTPPPPVQQQYAIAPPPYPVPQQYAKPVPTAFEVRIQVMADPHATVAHASLYAGGDPYTEIMKVSGSSKRDAGDVYNEETGIAIAVQRALANLSRKIGRRAEGQVKHADDSRRQRDAVKAEVAGVEEFLAHEDEIGIVSMHGDESGIVVHLSPGQSEQELPDGLKEMIGNLFPRANVTFTEDATDDIPAEIAKAVDEFLKHPENGVRRERSGKHAKG